MKFRTLAVCSLVLALAIPAFAETNPVTPGKWQFSMQMEMPGMPFKMPPVKFTHCVTEEDAKSAIPQNQKDKDCKVADYKVNGNTISWTVDCPKSKTKGEGEVTYEKDSMTGSMKMNADGQDMSMQYTGKRLGACDK